MEQPFKLATTAVIWLMSAVMVGITVGTGNVKDPFSLPVIFMIVGAALLATRSVWNSSGAAAALRGAERSVYEKPKRTSRDKLQNALNALDDDEAAALLEDFRARLSGGDDDGEISAVEALRAERRSR